MTMATAAARSWPPPRASDRLRPTLTAPPVDPDAETQNHQVQDHLDRDEHHGALAGRGDVTESDRGQGRQGEVQGVGPGELVGAEAARIVLGHNDIDAREHHQEQGRGERQSLDLEQPGIPGTGDPPQLQDDHDDENPQADQQRAR